MHTVGHWAIQYSRHCSPKVRIHHGFWAAQLSATESLIAGHWTHDADVTTGA